MNVRLRAHAVQFALMLTRVVDTSLPRSLMQTWLVRGLRLFRTLYAAFQFLS